MNSANLQLEGVYAAMTALMGALRDKGLLDVEEIDDALERAETALAANARRPTELSTASVEAICFPLRYLRLANQAAPGAPPPSFSELATRIGQARASR
jgi:hypothetical protein